MAGAYVNLLRSLHPQVFNVRKIQIDYGFLTLNLMDLRMAKTNL